MREPHRDDNTDPLAAEANDPKLGVHVLSEFAFCPRAGLCLYEQDEQYEERVQKPDASYLPILERNELERMLKAYSAEFWGWLLTGVTGTLVCGAVAIVSGYGLFWIGAAIVGLITFSAAIDRLKWAWRASVHLNTWMAAKPRMPDAASPEIQEISWCDLREAGFEPLDVPAAYSYEPWAFGGRPRKVLEYGDLRIPVFRYPRKWKGLFPQHFVRMTGYCKLLEKTTEYRSPYGVILRSDSLTATIVPTTERSVEFFTRALQDAREDIKAAREMNRFPPVPSGGAFCRECPWGKPEPYRRGKAFLRHTTVLDAKIVKTGRGKPFHCHCGDRFGSVPPHIAVEKLGLRE